MTASTAVLGLMGTMSLAAPSLYARFSEAISVALKRPTKGAASFRSVTKQRTAPMAKPSTYGFHPDVILMDGSMPVLDGYAAIAQEQEAALLGRERITAAAVLIALVEREGGLSMLLTQRTAHLTDHAGQISFPGGRAEQVDASPVETALREAEEEIGLARRHVDVLGSLPDYVTGTGYRVTPVVALVDPGHQLALNPDEVADAFEVPLAFLMNPAHHRRHALEWQGTQRQWFSMPYMDGRNERFVWGATAAMLRNLYRFLAA